MVINSQRTLFALDLEQHILFNKPYTPLDNTTLNELFNVATGITIPDGKYPYLNLLVIGVGGLQNIDDENTFKYSQHSPIDGALFDHIPFIARLTSADLTASEKSSYRLRTVTTGPDGKDYAVYYGKVLPSPDVKQIFYSIKTIADDVKVTSPTLTALDLNRQNILKPKQNTRSVSYKTANNIEYITKLNKLELSLTVTDLEEIKNACYVTKKDSNIITEMGLCTSYDINYNGYTEAVYTQIGFHMGVSFDIANLIANNIRIQKSIEIGGLEPYIR